MNQYRTILSLSVISILFAGVMPAQTFAEEDEIEIEVYLADGYSKIEIEMYDEEFEYKLDTDDEGKIILSIMDITGLDEDRIRDLWKFEVEEHDYEYKEYEEYDDYEDYDVYYSDVYKEYDYKKYRDHDKNPEHCIVEEDNEIIVVDEVCIFDVFDEIPKQDCIIETYDELIWYEKDCVFKDERVRHEEPKQQECIIEENDTTIVVKEECVLERFGEIPHQDCAEFDSGLVIYDKQCVFEREDYKHDKVRFHDKPSDFENTDKELIKRIHELEQENRFLQEKINDLEEQIANLNVLIREQLNVIYEWIINR